MKKVFIRTFGCQMNVRDSEIVRGTLEEEGYKFVDAPEKADIVIFNTCSVRAHAEDRALSILGAITRKKPRRIFGIIGCVAQHRKEALFRRIPNLDFVVGPSDIYKIPSVLQEIQNSKFKIQNKSPEPLASLGYEAGKIQMTKLETRPLDYINPAYRESKEQDFVNISYGCDNYCSYCIVPYVRGREVSRPVEDLLREVRELVDRGICEVMLLGQNVNSYKGLACSVERIAYSKKLNAIRYPLNAKTCDFVQLLEAINSIDGIKKISFMTSHPKDASDDLFKAIKELEHVEKHLHLPLQSGSNRILELMNRGYTIEKYRSLIDNYRKLLPNAGLTTDIIVGFPTETEEDYNQTKKVLQDIRFNGAFIFKYSPRPPAKSSEMKDDVSVEEKKRRNNELLELQRKIAKDRISGHQHIGK